MRIQASGPTLSAMFIAAGEALADAVSDRTRVQPETAIEIVCESSDLEFLLADWINTLLYEMNERRFLFSRFEISADGIHVRGYAWGEPYDPTRHAEPTLVDGVGFTDLKVLETHSGFAGTFVLDDPRHRLRPFPKEAQQP